MNIPQPPQNPNTPPPITPDKFDKKRTAIIIGLIGLLVATAVGLFIYKNSPGNGGGDSDSGDFVAMLPIWIAVWIPIMAAQKKKNQNQNPAEVEKSKKIMIGITLALVFLVIFGIIAWSASSK